MAHNAPGKHYRKGLTLVEVVQKFSTEAAAEAWFIEQRWPDGIRCPVCNSHNVQSRASRKPAPFRCRDCRKDFSVKTGTLMHDSKLPVSKWAIALFLYSTNLKGVSSLKLHRDLGITQKAAWHMAHRIRECFEDATMPAFDGPVEADEAAFGGLEKNKHAHKRQRSGRGMAGKTIVAGVKDRATNRVSAKVVRTTTRRELQAFIAERVRPQAMIYTDEHPAYHGLPHHQAVKHSVAQYVDGQAHTNGLESFWATLKRGYHGVHHHMSPKHLNRYVGEFAGRHNQRPMDTLDQMAAMARGMTRKRLPYAKLTAGGPAYPKR